MGTNPAAAGSASPRGLDAHGEELLLELDRSNGTPLRAQLEDGLREAVRSGRLAAHVRLPPTRALAADLGVSRRLVVDAYAQLLAEGYLVARPRRRHVRGRRRRTVGATRGAARGAAAALRLLPRLSGPRDVPAAAWLRALREMLRDAPDQALGYPDPRGASALRRALAGHLRRVRGVAADPDSIVVCSGAAQALALIGAELGGPHGRGRGSGAAGAPRDPRRGGRPARAARGRRRRRPRRAAARDRAGRGGRDAAHQSPTGVALSPSRRAALLAWAGRPARSWSRTTTTRSSATTARRSARCRGSRPSACSTRARSARRSRPPCGSDGWCCPRACARASPSASCSPTTARPTLDQLALARLFETGAYDRHLRGARRRYRARRDALVAAVARPSAGRLGHRPRRRAARDRAPARAGATGSRSRRRPRASPSASIRSGYAYVTPRPRDDGLVLGYANLPEPAIEEGIRRLARALGRAVSALTLGADAGDRRGDRAPGDPARPARARARARHRRAARSPGTGRTPTASGAGTRSARTNWVTARLGVIWPIARCAFSSQRNLRSCASENAP